MAILNTLEVGGCKTRVCALGTVARYTEEKEQIDGQEGKQNGHARVL